MLATFSQSLKALGIYKVQIISLSEAIPGLYEAIIVFINLLYLYTAIID